MRFLAFLVVAVVLAACAPRDADLRRARLASERRNLEATLDHLEGRLLASQARVRFWREMQARHESVSAVACASLDEHAVAMATRALPPPGRSSLHHAKVASAMPLHGATHPAVAQRQPASK